MKQHKRAVHMGDKNFRCLETGCGKKFRFKIQQKDHMRAVHNHDKLSCPRCGARFLSYSGHRAHVTRCRDDASSAENSQTHPKRAKNCSLLDSKVVFNKEAGHNFTGSNNVFHRNLHEDECKVSSVWLQRKGGSQKLDPPPLFKGGGGSGSPESQPSPKSLNFLLILYFSRSFLEHVS